MSRTRRDHSNRSTADRPMALTTWTEDRFRARVRIGPCRGDGDDYRGVYLPAAGGGEVVLTGPEHAVLPDDDLMAEAVREAYRGNIIATAAAR